MSLAGRLWRCMAWVWLTALTAGTASILVPAITLFLIHGDDFASLGYGPLSEGAMIVLLSALFSVPSAIVFGLIFFALSQWLRLSLTPATCGLAAALVAGLLTAAFAISVLSGFPLPTTKTDYLRALELIGYMAAIGCASGWLAAFAVGFKRHT